HSGLVSVRTRYSCGNSSRTAFPLSKERHTPSCMVEHHSSSPAGVVNRKSLPGAGTTGHQARRVLCYTSAGVLWLCWCLHRACQDQRYTGALPLRVSAAEETSCAMTSLWWGRDQQETCWRHDCPRIVHARYCCWKPVQTIRSLRIFLPI